MQIVCCLVGYKVRYFHGQVSVNYDISDMSEIKLDTLVLRVAVHQLAPTRCPLWVLEIQHPKLGIVNRDLGSGSPNTSKGPGKIELDIIAEMVLLLIIIINQG